MSLPNKEDLADEALEGVEAEVRFRLEMLLQVGLLL